MRTVLMRLAALVVVTTSGLQGQAQVVPPRADNQFWNETQLVKPLSERRDLVLIGGLRIGRGWERPVDERLGAGLAFKLSRQLTIQPTYLFVAYQPFPGREFTEHRLIFNLTGRVRLKRFTLADRNLVERRIRPGGTDFTTYRNRLMIDHPAKIGRARFNPFVANEIWYTTQPTATGRFGWSRNRLSAGILKQITPNFYAEIHYLHQNDGISRPGNIHTIMTFFRYTL